MKSTLHPLPANSTQPALSGLWLRCQRLFTILRERVRQSVRIAESEMLVRGFVCDEQHRPVAFARITLGRSRYQTMTNAAGHFVLHVPASGKNILFLTASGEGFREVTQRLVPNQQSTLDVSFVLRAPIPARVIPLSARSNKPTQ